MNLKLKKDQIDKLNTFQYTTTKIKYLASFNIKPYHIAKYLNIRPQFVSNVLNHKVKNPKETFWGII